MSRAPEPRVSLGMERPPLHADGGLRVGNATRGGLVAAAVTVLDSRLARARMLFARRLGPHEAVVVPAPGLLHSLGAPRPVRVAFLSSEGRVLQAADLPRWRYLAPPEGTAHALVVDHSNPCEIRTGDKLEWLRSQPRLEERADWLQSEL